MAGAVGGGGESREYSVSRRRMADCGRPCMEYMICLPGIPRHGSRRQASCSVKQEMQPRDASSRKLRGAGVQCVGLARAGWGWLTTPRNYDDSALTESLFAQFSC